MFTIRSRPHNPGANILNAQAYQYTHESQADRTTRHLATCRMVTELALVMAHNAAQAAEHEWTPNPEPAPAQTPEPPPAPKPETEPPLPACNPAPKTNRSTPSLRRLAYVSPTVAFTRLASCIRQTMALEARIAAKRAADTKRAETQAADHAWHLAEAARQPTPEPTQAQNPPRPKPSPETPSLLATISKEIGIDLETTTQHRTTGPP